ncbi:TonB-linked outer membrane protein, SusC/RagA family [Reichenbachiella faecimaris]|uniref:TonB-linked outer membrane protein, SusC/RagA family n=2 Tax=Reichenbachiella faecimaris TaxID=692418 RepID=A0A1W2GI44_REIFA|nr:TonB-linked outer membrane protein, SusC/RagA family [Reichenbachiella faecimaris]
MGLFLFAYQANAQQQIQGTVKDSYGESLIGVTILEQGTTNGTITDIDGNYMITVAGSESILAFSYVGYKKENRSVGSLSRIDLVLTEDSEQLETVVVTALGFEQKQDDLGYATSVVSNESIAKSGESTLLNSLSGKSSGIRISRNSGDPGAGAFIQIRGLSSVTRNSQPLIVVDGVPISNASRGNNEGIAQQSRLNDINPNDIESVSVLKGASAAALWGTQALGGVIMIKTKSGKYNQDLQVSFKSSYSVDVINRKYPLQTKFGQGNNGVWAPNVVDSWGDKISDRTGGEDELDTSGEYFMDQNGKVWYPVVSKNSQTIYDDFNFDQIFQNGHFWENNISLTAGNDKGNIFFSIGDMNQEGIIKNNSDYRRTTVRTNAEYLMTSKLRINANSTYIKTKSNRIRRGASSSGLYLGLLRTAPDFDNSGYRGSYFGPGNVAPIVNRHRSYRNPVGSSGSAGYNNPSWTINEQQDLAEVDRFINTFKLTYSPTTWLDLIGRVGIDHYSEEREQFYTPGSAAGAFGTGLFSNETAVNAIFNMDYIAKASKSFGDNFSGTLLVGFNYNNRRTQVDGSEINNFIQYADVAGITRDIDNALPENRSVASSYGSERTVGTYSELTVSAYDMLFATGTVRAESASTFGDADNTFVFPSVTLAWKFSELLDFDFLSFGKLRGSYGEVGVQPARYSTSNVFVSPTYADSYGGGLSLGLYGNGGFVPSTNRGNPSLKPERKKEFEVGSDLRFLGDRLSLSGTYFNNTTSDVLLDFPVANSRGYDEIYANAAEIKNSGVELDLGYTVLRTSHLSWQLNFIYTQVDNEVTDLVGVESLELGGLSAVNNRVVEGQPHGILWGSRTLRDDDGNIVYDAFGFPEQDEEEGIIGDPNPDWQGSIISTLKYKGFTLSALFETYQGADIYAGTKSALYDLGRWEDSGLETTANQNLLDYNGNVILAGTTFRGTIGDFGAGPVALTQPWYSGDGGFFGNGNDELYIEDGSWTRLRELSLSYALTSPWLKSKTGLRSAEISVTGRNLLLWTPFEGNDPDTNFSGVSSGRGIDYFNNPGTKSYIFTLLLNF